MGKREFGASEKSVRTYEKSGRLNVAWSKFSQGQQHFFEECERVIEPIMMKKAHGNTRVSYR